MHYNLSINIMTKGTRSRWLEYLSHMLYEEDPAVSITTIKNSDSLIEAWLETMTTIPAETTHLLVLQDDVLPCKDFISSCNQIVGALPDEVITLYTNEYEPTLEAIKAGDNYIKLGVFIGAVAYIIPVPTIVKLLEFYLTSIKKDIYADDEIMATYFFYSNKPIYATVPSLVEHIGFNDSTISQINRSNLPKRVAGKFIGFEKSGLSINWQNTNAKLYRQGHNSQFCSNLL